MSRNPNRYDAQQIIAMLAAKHFEDVFVSECKDGPTWYGSHLRLDGWAMKKSWANPCIIGYEVKVSRSDWTSDRKWMEYREVCNELYLVCPADLIPVSEVPDWAGLLWASKVGSKLLTKKKAPYRDTDPKSTEPVPRYILMSRATIDAKREPRTRDEWQEWLARKREDRSIGYNVAKGLREVYEREVEQVKRRHVEIEKKQIHLANVERQLQDRWGITLSNWFTEYQVSSDAARIAARLQPFTPDRIRSLKEAQKALTEIVSEVESDQAALTQTKEGEAA